MPHTPDTHITITPKHVHINGEPISVTKNTVELRTSSPVEIQTVTLTVSPTSVTILNEDDANVVNAAHEAAARHTRGETTIKGREHYLVNSTCEALDKWKRHEAARAKHTRT